MIGYFSALLRAAGVAGPLTGHEATDIVGTAMPWVAGRAPAAPVAGQNLTSKKEGIEAVRFPELAQDLVSRLSEDPAHAQAVQPGESVPLTTGATIALGAALKPPAKIGRGEAVSSSAILAPGEASGAAAPLVSDETFGSDAWLASGKAVGSEAPHALGEQLGLGARIAPGAAIVGDQAGSPSARNLRGAAALRAAPAPRAPAPPLDTQTPAVIARSEADVKLAQVVAPTERAERAHTTEEALWRESPSRNSSSHRSTADDSVELSIGAIHIQVDPPPAPRTSATPRQRTTPSQIVPRPSLARRSLRRL